MRNSIPFIAITMKRFLLMLLCACCSLAAMAQADVRGFVYDQASGEPVMFANVFLEGTTMGASTDVEGLYSIAQVPTGEYTLVATTVGYDTAKVAIMVPKSGIVSQKMFLNKQDVMLNAFDVTGTKTEQVTQVRTGAVKITPKQINKLPAIGGEPDLAQYLQVLPGVVFTGDQGGQLYIRGGSPIQTKVLMDGMTIYNPFHSVGLFSVFETDLIRNVDVLTGGFNAEYGGRISAAIDVTTRDGNKKKMAGKVGANTFLAKAILEGPIVKLKEDENSLSASYVFTAKTSYLNQSSKFLYPYIENGVATETDENGNLVEVLPYSFTDLYGKLSFNLGNGSKINFSGYRNTDFAKFQGQSEYAWDAWGMGTKFVMVPGQSKMIIDGFFSYSTYNIELTEADAKPRYSEIGGFNGGVNFSYFLPSGDVKYGIELSGFGTKFEFFTPLGFKTDENQNTTEIGGFFKYKVEVADQKFLFEPSVRINYYASLPQFTFEPRLGMKYNVSPSFRIKASGGQYTQNFISTKSDRDVVNLFTGFLSAPEGQLYTIEGDRTSNNLQTATHAIFGIEYDITRGLSLNAETYFKRFGQLINVNRQKLFPDDPDYIVEQGDAYGVDLLLKYDRKNWFVWGVYSLSYANRTQFNDRLNIVETYPPHFDRRHNMNFLGSYKFGKGNTWETSIRWNMGSGFPFTKTQGFYEQLDFTDGIDVDYVTQNGNLGVIYSDELNGGRLPYYHRMDFSMKKTWGVGAFGKLEASASLTNVYNRENIFYFDRIRYDRVNQLPILPSFGVNFSF